MWNAIVIFFFLFVSCAPAGRDERISAKKKIISTTAQIADLVAFVGGSRIESDVLVRGELNPHSYELVKGDGEKLSKAQIVFYNGLGLEHGASVSAMIDSHPNAVGIGEEIARLHPEQILKREETVDPHIWMDVSLWKGAVDPIADHLSKIDPEGEAEYRQRAEVLKAEMDRVDLAIRTKLQAVPAERRYLVTSHDAFQYFTRRYLAADGESDWEKRFAAPEGLSPDGQLSIADLRAIVNHLQEHQITIIFPESNVNRDSLKKIADMTHVRICKQALFGDSIRGGYLASMMHNGETLAEELNREGLKDREMSRRHPEFESGEAGAESRPKDDASSGSPKMHHFRGCDVAAKLKKFSDTGGSQSLRLPDVDRTDDSIRSGVNQ